MIKSDGKERKAKQAKQSKAKQSKAKQSKAKKSETSLYFISVFSGELSCYNNKGIGSCSALFNCYPVFEIDTYIRYQPPSQAQLTVTLYSAARRGLNPTEGGVTPRICPNVVHRTWKSYVTSQRVPKVRL